MIQNKENVVITGVSTGIGYGILKECVKRGYRVFGSVRKNADAEKLKAEFGDAFHPLIFDVTNEEAVLKSAKEVNDSIGNGGIKCLVNNSGIALGGPLQYQSMEEIERHFQVNVIGLMRVTKAFLELLGARENHPCPPGRIINISSVAGKFAQPFVGAYVGSKHAVEGLSQSLRRELLLYDIDVIVVGPGAVKTPIWDKGIQMQQYSDTPYGKVLKRFGKVAKKGGEEGLTIEYLGQSVADIIEKDKPNYRYAFVPDKLKNWTIPMLLPEWLINRTIRKKLFGK